MLLIYNILERIELLLFWLVARIVTLKTIRSRSDLIELLEDY